MDVYVELEFPTGYKYEKIMTFEVLPRIGDMVEVVSGQAATVSLVCHMLEGKLALRLRMNHGLPVRTMLGNGWEEVPLLL